VWEACGQGSGELGEQAAGFDLGELAGVTDQHEVGAAESGVGEERVEPPRAPTAHAVVV
jgi:hypothetical protein